ncbi:MAG: DEAD/DEAH box helicase [Gemmataceae bacterium]|nr:DEAD/DEAH box helicase [Gemmataceae bacterium]
MPQAEDTSSAIATYSLGRFESLSNVTAREARLLTDAPWVRSPVALAPTVRTEGWKFPAPVGDPVVPTTAPGGVQDDAHTRLLQKLAARTVRPKPTADTVMFKDRLLYLLQPPIESLFVGKQVTVPFPPYPYQLEGLAFLMPRRAALLADEMGLGKTMQTILSMRLLFQSGMIRRALLVCPKPLVFNWCRELKSWSPDLPFEVVGGSTASRRASWTVSNSPLKIVNYEVLTRDHHLIDDVAVRFDLVILDEAQRIKNRESKTAQAARALRRDRSWALTGTPIENKPEDLINLFAFVDPGRVPQETPTRQIPALTGDCILRRTKDDVLTDLPAKTVTDACLELSPAQRAAYDRAEKDGIVHLNELGDTATVQHVFELVMRLKQICNFDPLTGDSCKLERLTADLAEVAESGRKALVFSQWVEPLEKMAAALEEYGPLQYHGRIPTKDRTAVLDQFKADPSKHVLLMSYGTGSVGLNLQFCSYVFLFDRWWNPAIEDQAINRAHRIGQKEPVFVTRFVTHETIEGRIAEILDRKRQLFDELINQNEPPPRLGLSEDEIFGLFQLPQPHRHRKAA